MSNWKQLTPSVYHQLALGSAYGLTDVGLVRKSNEDNFMIDQDLGLVIVGDGMGGHEGGEIASANALTLLRDYLAARMHDKADAAPAAQAKTIAEPLPSSLRADSYDPDATWSDESMSAIMMLFEAVEFANAQLFAENLANHNGEGRGMGTTLTGIWQCNNTGPLLVFHVGDSRLYRLRNNELTVMTRDQTLYQQAIEEGIVDNLPPRNLLLQAIGPSPSVKPDIEAHTYLDGDLYLLCSDGLYGTAPHAAIQEIMAAAHSCNLEQCCTDLVEMAKEHGSRDNITAILTLCHDRDKPGGQLVF